MRAASFEVHAPRAQSLCQRLLNAGEQVTRPSGALVFISKASHDQLERHAESVAAAKLGFTVVLASSAGVISERAELEAEHAATGMVWGGGASELTASSFAGTAKQAGRQLAEEISGFGPRDTVLVLAAPDDFDSACFKAHDRQPVVFGGGTTHGAIGISADGDTTEATTVGLRIRGQGPPVVRVALPCRWPVDMQRISECDGPLLTGVGGKAALNALADTSPGGDGLVVVLVAAADDAPEFAKPPQVLTIRGVDPERLSLMLSGPISKGDWLAFRTCDPSAGRAGIEAVARHCQRQLAGAAPSFGIYFNCAGRGRRLYASPDVDLRAITERFRGMPVVGMHSSFELLLGPPGMLLQSFTGVLGVFGTPS